MSSSRAGLVLVPAALDFVRERHLATLTTLRADGTPHVVPVGFTWDADTGIARIITDDASAKAANVRGVAYAAVSQFDKGRWITLEGRATVLSDRDSVLDGEHRYTERYKTPRINPTRVVIAITVDRVLSSQGLR